jgi:hypothetical protein
MWTGMRIVRAWSAIARVDPLANPPLRVGRELEAAPPVELLDRAGQADVPLLDQVEQRHAPADVALGDAHHQPEVGLGQAAARRVALVDGRPQLGPLLGSEVRLRQLPEGFLAVLDGLGQRHLVRRIEEGHATDLAQVHRRRRGDARLRGVDSQIGLGVLLFQVGLFGHPAVLQRALHGIGVRIRVGVDRKRHRTSDRLVHQRSVSLATASAVPQRDSFHSVSHSVPPLS